MKYEAPPTLIGKKIAYIYPSYDEYECIGYSCGLIGLKKSNGDVIWVSPCGRTAIKERADAE